MPLTDLVRHLNARSQAAGHGSPFLAEGGKVQGSFAGWTLESHFQPILEKASGRLYGHAAKTRARLPHLGLDPSLGAAALFVLARHDQDFIHLDRLIRTLHALNYLTQPQRGNLLLKVHPRHVLAVPDGHGLAFEEILRPCGLLPEQITLELDAKGIRDTGRLGAAVGNYRDRGFGISVEAAPLIQDDSLAERLRPDIVRLGPGLRPGGLAGHGRASGARLLAEEGGAQLFADVDLVQSRSPLAASSWEETGFLAA